jgi:MoaA/NifB/PqqE/SkfB family radical SAM enzyme
MDIKKLLDIDSQNVTPMIPAARLEEMANIALRHTQKKPLSGMEKFRGAWNAHPWAQRGLAVAACLVLLLFFMPPPPITLQSSVETTSVTASAEGDVYDDDFTDLMVLATLDDL